MVSGSTREITLLISKWQGGDQNAEGALFDALYTALREIAIRCLKREREPQSLSPTALVHEAYLRLMRAGKLNISDRSHFLKLIARVMRRIIVDRARSVHADKRGGEARRVDLFDATIFTDDNHDEILAVDTALSKLARERPREASLVEMRFFGGFSLEEAAAALDISTRTARRDWERARIFLKDAIDGNIGKAYHT